MFTEIAKAKKLSIFQYDNDVQLYFDAIKFLKLQIDQKDSTAYTRMHSFEIFFFSSSMIVFQPSFALNSLVRRLVG